MIDVSTEQLLPITVAARETPNRAGGRGVNVSTIWRWAISGCRGVVLETIMAGGIRMTSREAMQRFFEAVTVAASGKSAAPPSPSSINRDREIAEVKATLNAAGI